MNIPFLDSSQDILFENDITEKERNATELPIRIRGSFLESEGGNITLNFLSIKSIPPSCVIG